MSNQLRQPTSNEGRSSRQPTAPAWMSVGLIAGPVLFTLAWLALGFISTGYSLWDIHVEEYSPISQPIGGLGLGNTAPYMNTAFVVSGLLIVTGSFGFVSCIPDLTRKTRWALGGLLALHGLGAIIDGIFTLESADLHFLGFLLAISPIVTFPLIGRRLRRIPGWRRLGTGLIWSSPLTVVLVAAFFATFDPTAADGGVAGLTQRLLVVEMQVWAVALGWLALRRPFHPDPLRRPRLPKALSQEQPPHRLKALRDGKEPTVTATQPNPTIARVPSAAACNHLVG